METTTMQDQTTFTICGIDFITFMRDGWYIASASKVLKSKRIQHVFAYKFRKEQERDEYVTKYTDRLQKDESEKQERKAALSAAKNFDVNPFKMGDIFADSWGYDQTNIDFYQVVEVKPKSIVLVEINGTVVPGSSGHDCCRVTPVKDSFKNLDLITKVVLTHIGSDGKAQYHIASRHGWCTKHEDGKDYFNSWYA